MKQKFKRNIFLLTLLLLCSIPEVATSSEGQGPDEDAPAAHVATQNTEAQDAAAAPAPVLHLHIPVVGADAAARLVEFNRLLLRFL